MSELAHDMKHEMEILGNALERASQEVPDFFKQQIGVFQLSESTGNLKRKELMAIAVSVYAQCHYCIAYHIMNAVKEGATRADILEAATVGVELGGGVAITYMSYVLDGCDQFGAK
jgi:AhpD family alkylhydroperoxidase